jgi:hypothetical protein
MDALTIYDRLQQMKEKTQRAIRGGEKLMNETRLLVEQSQASCRTTRVLLETLEESLLSEQMGWREPDRYSSAPNRS